MTRVQEEIKHSNYFVPNGNSDLLDEKTLELKNIVTNLKRFLDNSSSMFLDVIFAEDLITEDSNNSKIYIFQILPQKIEKKFYKNDMLKFLFEHRQYIYENQDGIIADKDSLGKNLLYHAIESKNYEFVRKLIDKVEIDKLQDLFNVKTKFGFTAFHALIDMGNFGENIRELEIFELLTKKGIKFPISSKDSKDILRFAATSGKKDMVEYLLKEKIPDDYNFSELIKDLVNISKDTRTDLKIFEGEFGNLYDESTKSLKNPYHDIISIISEKFQPFDASLGLKNFCRRSFP